MTKEGFKELKQIIKSYSDKRDEVYDKVAQLEKEVKTGKRYSWAVRELELDYYQELSNCPERKAYIAEERKIHGDVEFEKFFRSAAMEYFLGLKISPEKL